LLPFGLITDVSAGGAAAGAGGLPGAAKPIGNAGAKSVFETELGAHSQAFEDVAPEGPNLPVLVSEEFVFPPEFRLPLGESEFDLSGQDDALTDLAALDAGADGALPDEGSFQVPNGAEGALPGQFAIPRGGADFAPVFEPGTLPDASLQPLPAGVSAPAFVNGPANGGQQTPQPIGFRLVAPLEAAPADLPQGGDIKVADVLKPEVGVAKGKSLIAEPELPNPLASKPDVSGAQVSVPEVRPERRWQAELPSELRAPVPSFDKPLEATTLQPVTTPLPSDEVRIATPAVPAPLPGGMQQNLTAPTEVQSQQVPPQVPGKVVTHPVDADLSGVADDEITNIAKRAGAEPGTVSVTQFLRQTSATTETRLELTQVVSGRSGTADPSGFAPVTLEGDAAGKAGTAAEGATLADAKSPNPAVPNGADQARQLPAGPVQERPAGTPIVAAALEAQLPPDDPQLLGNSLEPNPSGEFAATVRGGEVSGALRTESLQLPNQAQSGQVSTQVAAEIARNLKNGQTRFQMRFDPPELGRVDVNMRVGADGGVHAHLIVERPETLDMFLRDQRGLERALEAAGLKAESENLQFSLKQESGRDFASSDGRSDQTADLAGAEDGAEADDADRDAEEVVRLTLAGRPGGLDLKI